MLTGCSLFEDLVNKSTEKESIDIVDVGSTEDEEQFFLPNDDGYIYKTSGLYLRLLYNWNYHNSYSNYGEFKKLILNGKINLDYKTIQCDTCVFYYYEDKFKIDSLVMVEYKDCDIRAFIDRYCKVMDSCHDNKSLLWFKEDIDKKDENKKLTIAYCLWLNGYHYHSRDCFNDDFFSKDKHRENGKDPKESRGQVFDSVSIPY